MSQWRRGEGKANLLKTILKSSGPLKGMLANVIRILEDEHGYKNLVNLKGGILAWQEEIQNGLARY